MTKALFGTDGIRGLVNRAPMTADVMLRFGMAIGLYLSTQQELNQYKQHKLHVVIAKDTRLSGYMIESALTAGLVATGVDVTLVGPMPTPSVSMLVKSLRADFGIMITASHNPYYDNGLKLFDRRGYKLSREIEAQIQELVLNCVATLECWGVRDSETTTNFITTKVENLGKAFRLEDAKGRYIEYVKSSFPKTQTLTDTRIVVDCANGANYYIAPKILWELGADIVKIGCDPNGLNINDGCGSVHPQLLAAKVLETRADIGISFDGDGDRLLICDEQGRIINGDHVIGVIAKYLHDTGKLRSDGIVITETSNSALNQYLNKHGIKTWIAEVGDRNVGIEMSQRKTNFGGEQSGHLIYSDYSTTGDGTLSALQVLAVLRQSQQKTSELFDIFELMPQVNLNVNLGLAAQNPLEDESIQLEIEDIKKINQQNKIIIRKSGTENVIRILVEGANNCVIKNVAHKIENVILKALHK